MRSTCRSARTAACSIVLIAAALASAGPGQIAPVEAGSAATKITTATLVWHSIPSVHTARYDAGAEWYRQRIFVIGGFDAHGAALSSVESYDLDYNRWTAAPPMSTARGDFGIWNEGPDTPITVFWRHR